jgi:hypothetical protein
MVFNLHEEMLRKQGIIDQKAVDEAQKYRLEGWKKANDAIIEDQKRVYEAFKSEFDQLFDAFTDRTKSLGQALGDFFKKLALGELKETFSSQMAAIATQEAGYGRPEETITRGQGILGILLRRGMPPRPPGAPPGMYVPGSTEEGIKYGGVADSVTAITPPALNAASSLDQLAEAATAATAALGGGAGGEALPRAAPYGSQFFQYIRGGMGGAAFGGAITQLPPPSQAEAGQLAEIRRRESTGNYGALNIPLPGQRPSTASGAYQMIDATWKEMAHATGIGEQYEHARDAPKWMQDANALFLLRQRGTKPWASTGPYPSMGATAAAGLPAQLQPLVPQFQGWEPPTELPFATPGAAPFLSYAAARPFTPPEMAQVAAPMTAEFPEAPPVMPAAPSGFSWDKVLASIGIGTPGGPGAPPATTQVSQLARLAQLFGIGGGIKTVQGVSSFGGTSFASVAGSQGAGQLYSMLGMMALSQGLQKRNAPMTILGGALGGAGFAAMNPALFSKFGAGGPLAGAMIGVGAGTFAAGVQRGGYSGLAMDVGGGALAGAGIGTMIMPGIGTAIGAAIGAGAGAIAGVVRLFVKTEQERIRQQIKQVYGIDISNRQILTQIQQIIDQKYGGSVSIGIRSQDVQDIVRLYALSQGQAANLPRPMYAATVAEAGGKLALQPVYQGGQLVQNPYTGPTTYQYQTAVTEAQGLKAGTSQGVPGATPIIQSTFIQLNAQQAQSLMTGQVVGAIQANPSAVASAGASAARAGDSRMTTTAAMTSPLTALP